MTLKRQLLTEECRCLFPWTHDQITSKLLAQPTSAHRLARCMGCDSSVYFLLHDQCRIHNVLQTTPCATQAHQSTEQDATPWRCIRKKEHTHVPNSVPPSAMPAAQVDSQWNEVRRNLSENRPQLQRDECLLEKM